MTPERVAPLIGSRIGVYRIDAMLGAGGMGEVYRAHDTKLGRDVAIKILPPTFANDPDRLTRFEREARVLASLNHPNIAAIYGLEDTTASRALVLELVEGETLAERLQRGAIPVPEALGVACQTADALDAAHAKGIVHRDLKPANIKFTPAGAVKVLDFGLAKLVVAGLGPDLSESATMTVNATREGVIVGTAPYMSPEQARGRPLDKRTDIWSFGCVLYEMLTGRRPFAGQTLADTVAAVLEREPDWSLLPNATPETVRRLLQRCLEKDPTQRLRDIGDIRLEIGHALATESGSRGRAVRTMSRSSRASRPVVGGGAIVVLVGIIVAVFALRRPRPSTMIPESPVQLTNFNDSATAPSLSHDGRTLAFLRPGLFGRSAAPRGQVYVKSLPNGQPVQLTRDPVGKDHPVFAPDDTRIVYTALLSRLRWDSWQVPVLGGAPQLFLPNASGVVWLDDRRVMYSTITAGIHMGIATSTESRSEYKEVYFPGSEREMAHRSSPSPDGQAVLVVQMAGDGTWLPCRLVPAEGSSAGRSVGPPDGQCTSIAWSPDGRWMYFSSNAGGAFHVWRQRYPDGAPEPITFGPTEQEGTAITPDGKYLITSMGLQRSSVWLQDAGDERQLTDEAYASRPTMTASGARMFYLVRTEASRAEASGELWSVDLNAGTRQRVLPGIVMTNYSLSRDGARVVFLSSGNERGDGIWIADLERRSPPRQLTRGKDLRAFCGAPGEVVYLGEGGRLYRMKEDGSDIQMIFPDAIADLTTVSPDGRWAVVLVAPGATDMNTRLEFLSLRGEKSFKVCNDDCGFGPRSFFGALPFSWSPDGKWMFVNLSHFGKSTPRTIVLPYRADAPAETLWPRGLQLEQDVAANPGAKVINAGNTFPASGAKAYLVLRTSTQSNLYRVRIPN